MSLINKPTDTVVIYPEVVTTSPDGNVKTEPSQTGTPCRARIGPVISSMETMSKGYRTVEHTSMTLVGWQGEELGAQSQVELRGQRWAIDGDPDRYNGSARTRRTTYALKRY